MFKSKHPHIQDFIARLLNYEAEYDENGQIVDKINRMSAAEALMHPWIQQTDKMMLERSFREKENQKYVIGALRALSEFSTKIVSSDGQI